MAICPVLISQCSKVLLAQLPTHAYVTFGGREVLLLLIFSLDVLYQTLETTRLLSTILLPKYQVLPYESAQDSWTGTTHGNAKEPDNSL